MAVKLQDIADRLGVSPALVSCVLNDKPGSWANGEMRQRILDTAREMNYRPNSAGRALRDARSRAVGLPFLVPEGDIGRHGMVIGTLSRLLSSYGYHLIVDVALTQQQTIALIGEMAATRRCDAFVLWADESLTEQQAAAIAPYEVPFVAKGYYETTHPEWPQFEFDHFQMMRNAVSHLASAGQRRIAYLGHPTEAVYAAKLRAGFDQACCERFGSPPHEGLVAVVNDASGTTESIRRWMALPPAEQPTALVIATGEADTWIHVEFALAQAGRRIGREPSDFMVCGLRHTLEPLLFGNADAFPATDLNLLTEVLFTELLLPLLEGKSAEQKIVRVTPDLEPVRSLSLPMCG